MNWQPLRDFSAGNLTAHQPASSVDFSTRAVRAKLATCFVPQQATCFAKFRYTVTTLLETFRRLPASDIQHVVRSVLCKAKRFPRICKISPQSTGPTSPLALALQCAPLWKEFSKHKTERTSRLMSLTHLRTRRETTCLACSLPQIRCVPNSPETS